MVMNIETDPPSSATEVDNLIMWLDLIMLKKLFQSFIRSGLVTIVLFGIIPPFSYTDSAGFGVFDLIFFLAFFQLAPIIVVRLLRTYILFY